MMNNKFRIWDKIYKAMFQVSDISWACDGSIVYINGYIAEDVILMQSTGLPDRNGKEIFDGDIVEHYAFYGYVLFEDGMFTMSGSANIHFGKYKQPLCYHDSIQCEVIGNIHDNPELLEATK